MTPLPPRERLRSLKRASLLGAPTPIDRLERFEKAIASPYPIFIKRDDAIPFGFGGNKVRKLDLVMAEAVQEGFDSVITCGGVQSNHCRATAAAATRLGLRCHLVLSGEAPATLSGNTRLDDVFGATLHFVAGRLDRAPAMTSLGASLRAEGGKPTIIPLGASTPLGASGLALGIFEMIDQGHRPDVIIHASSSGGTQAGLLAGITLEGLKTRVIGISADESETALRRTVEGLERGVLDLAGSDADVTRAEVMDRFVGDGYGLETDGSREALNLLARAEAILVDHTYTAKALAGLIALVRDRSIAPGSTILFWHTGGQVGVLAR
ncbi:MAG: pyridoxal-phosphate dependent enzyme [Vicinamibacteria bacterium]|nr:pyridoxal-phosphate dependent enzyme [Vicinamibacteria bacterium]